jgi:2-dehydro-3-deoxygalactonokinase
VSSEFIALDWGTTSFRAYHVKNGAITNTVSASAGILSVADGDFDAALESHIGKWDTKLPVLAAGMITSRQGWIELPYVPCPAGPSEFARNLHHHVSKKGRKIAFATGLSFRDSNGTPDVMRSEETQVFGAMEGDSGHFITPGTHSKWIDVADGRIVRFSTYVTGEVFAALKAHTILGKLMKDGPENEEAFATGVRAALADPAGFLNRIFSSRSLALFNELPAEHISSYLSGQVIGTEVAHAMSHNPKQQDYTILASPGIADRYAKALAVAGLKARIGESTAIVTGLARIAKAAGLIA